MKKTKGGMLFILFLVVFLDLVGVGIVIPILAPLMLEGGELVPAAWTQNTRSIALGFLLASYPLAQFIGAPILGKLSDRYGRKKLLSTSLVGTFIGYLLFAIGLMTSQLWLLYASRTLDGFTGGNIAVANSAIADLSPDPKSKARNFGLVGMAFGLGFVLGPTIGGLLSDPELVSWFSPELPFLFAAGLSLFNLFFIQFKFKETLKNRVLTKISLFSGFQNIRKAFQIKRLRIMFLVTFFHAFGFAFFTHFFAVFLVQKFGYGPTEIGIFFAYIGVWVALGQGPINALFVNYFSSEKILRFAFPMLAISLVVMTLPKTELWLYLVQPPIAIFEGMAFPNSTTIISKLSTDDQQGEMLGITQSIRAFADGIPPIIAGFIVAFSPNLPTLVSGALILCAGMIFIFFFKMPRSHKA